MKVTPDRIMNALPLPVLTIGQGGKILHANSAAAALTRLEQLVQEAVITVPRALIAEAIDLIVFIKGRGAERRVESIVELSGVDEDDNYVLKQPAAPHLHVV